MKLSELGFTPQAGTEIIFVDGNFTATGLLTAEGTEYLVGKLKAPIMVRCSTMKDLPAQEFDELYLRPEIANSDAWEPVDKEAFEKAAKDKTPYTGGIRIPGYLADFSKNQEIPVYQAETIAQWAKGKRKADGEGRNNDILERIRNRNAQKTGG